MSRSRSPVAFGQYIITRRIARGGMAEIYRARTRTTAERASEWVAVKMMRHALGHEELREHLFKREAKIASMIDHENVIPLVQFGLEMERYYIAMEYVRGRDLSHLLKSEKKGSELLPFELGLYIGLQAAAGLGYAHRLRDERGEQLGIVHRDISPGNVMVGYSGTVKVLDFGVARMNESEGMRTQTGTLRGKFAYMSPEQTLGEGLDARSDVFSLGTVLYELLTGANCFRAENPIATLEKVQRVRPVPPSRANREIPKSVDRILARCLAKDRKRRFQDCVVLYEALGEFLDKRNFSGKAALARHMSDRFGWEKEEEERELQREEEEVALIDVVDFALVGEDGGLDAANVAVSLQEEASQSEVNRAAKNANVEGDEQVFDEEEERSARERAPSPAQTFAHGIGADDAEEKTIAHPTRRPAPFKAGALSAAVAAGQAIARRFQDPEEVASGQSVELSSLLAAESPFAREDIPTPRAERPPSRAAPPANAPLLLVGKRAPEFLQGLLGPAGVSTLEGEPASQIYTAQSEKRTIAWRGPQGMPKPLYLVGALVVSVLAVATLVSFGIDSQTNQGSANRTETPQPPKRTMIAPVTITVEDVVIEKERPAAADLEEKTIERSAGLPTREEQKTAARTREPRRVSQRSQVVQARLERDRDRADKERSEKAERDRAERVEKERAERAERDRDREKKAAPEVAISAPAGTPSSGKQIGYLNVGAKPWAEISIDGKPWPYQTPQAGIELTPGKHTITLFNRETGVTKSKVVQIKAGTYQTISMDMSKK
jgi:serine/threonine protein kinase